MKPLDHWLINIGKRVRSLRAQRGVSRRDLSGHAEISERYLAQVESGQANLSFSMLYKISRALDIPLLELADPGDASTTDNTLRQLLRRMDEEQKQALLEHAQHIIEPSVRQLDGRIALIGMRGAGKTTLGSQVADALSIPFVRLGDHIQDMAGMNMPEILDLGGQNAYRRWERSALEDCVVRYDRCILEVSGSIVSEPTTYQFLRDNCYLVWLKASAEQHMNRVIQQGDLRPFEGYKRALDDLKLILQERTELYNLSDAQVNTGDMTEQQACTALLQTATKALKRSE